MGGGGGGGGGAVSAGASVGRSRGKFDLSLSKAIDYLKKKYKECIKRCGLTNI